MESPKEKISRLEMMADAGESWDLSDHDTAAIRWILARYKQAHEVLLVASTGEGHDAERARKALKDFA